MVSGLPEAVSIAPPDDATRLIFLATGAELPLSGLLAGGANHGGVTVIVGPEGGFTTNEAAAAIEAGFSPAGLGPRVLRAETAAITALSVIQYELGDLGQSVVKCRT